MLENVLTVTSRSTLMLSAYFVEKLYALLGKTTAARICQAFLRTVEAEFNVKVSSVIILELKKEAHACSFYHRQEK
jgi:hypothetical protein